MKLEKKPQRPGRKDAGRYDRWVKYLTGTNITPEQVHERATQLTKAGKDPK